MASSGSAVGSGGRFVVYTQTPPEQKAEEGPLIERDRDVLERRALCVRAGLDDPEAVPFSDDEECFPVEPGAGLHGPWEGPPSPYGEVGPWGDPG